MINTTTAAVLRPYIEASPHYTTTHTHTHTHDVIISSGHMDGAGASLSGYATSWTVAATRWLAASQLSDVMSQTC